MLACELFLGDSKLKAGTLFICQFETAGQLKFFWGQRIWQINIIVISCNIY
jgi:hypothetical protein